MESYGFRDGNVYSYLDQRFIGLRHDFGKSLQMHSSLIRRLSQERELEGHQGCVNTIAWNANGSLLISGSDDKRVNVWSYSGRKLLHSIDSGHSANIFCTKFVPETSDELVVSGAGDGEVRLFNLTRLSGRCPDDNAIDPSAVYRCHSRRVKKLAIEPGNPNVVWSASEDGTLRQHDFRESPSCPPAGSSPQLCRNILLDLRSGAKRSLAKPPKQTLSLKSCDISASRPHLLVVGGSDAFARLYDRRMLPPLSSCRKFVSPPPCVDYLCPMHLSDCALLMFAEQSFLARSETNFSNLKTGQAFNASLYSFHAPVPDGRSSVHLTHVAFSPSGEEVLLSYSGEHVYLMNSDCAGRKSMQYTTGDASKLTTFTPLLNGLELQSPPSDLFRGGHSPKGNFSSTLEKCKKLLEFAKRCLEEEKDYFYGIEACNEVLDGHGHVIGTTVRLECLCTRAALLLKRNWKNDVHMAVRDCYNARRIDSSSFRALFYMSEALCQLGKHKESLDFAIASQCISPSDSELTEWVENKRKNLVSAVAEKNSKASGGTHRSQGRSGRALSLSDILFRSEANSDASQEGPRSEQEDSDYDEGLELGFETSMSGDEGHDIESDILDGSLNLRIHRRNDSTRATSSTNESCGSPSSTQNGRTAYQLETAIDMKQRYVGHCNVGTDIKQASFLGQRGEYVASGSDDGRWFVWEKQTGRLIKILLGDEAVVNCVQCHPFDPVIATSGIDDTIKIWSPNAPVPSIVSGGAAGPETSNFLETMEGNQNRLNYNREVVLPFEFLERSRMLEFTEGTLHPFECAQS